MLLTPILSGKPRTIATLICFVRIIERVAVTQLLVEHLRERGTVILV